MGFEGFPQTSFNITLMSLLVAAIVATVCLTFGKARKLSNIRLPLLFILLIGVILSGIDYYNYKHTNNDISIWLAIGPSLLVCSLYGLVLSFPRPALTLRKALGVLIMFSPFIAG